MAKARFNMKGVMRANRALATMQVELPGRQAVHIQTVDNTVMATLLNCVTLLTKFETLSAKMDGPAFICHQDMASARLESANDSQLYRLQYSVSSEVVPVIEARPHGMVFLEVLKLVQQLRSYRQQHRFTPLLAALLKVESDFSDVVDLAWFNGCTIEAALSFVCLQQLNSAVALLQSAITNDTFITDERSFYASVRTQIDSRVNKLRSLTHAPGKLSYLSVIDLFFHHEHHPDGNDPCTFYRHQRHKTRFAQIAQAVGSLIAKLRKRKQLKFFDGVVVSIKYSEVRGWYGSAMLLFNYPEKRATNISDRVHEAVTAIMEIWRLEISAVEGKGGSPIYPHASIHTPAFLCPSLPVINSQNSELYFFSANASEHHGNEVLKLEQEKLKPIVDALDYLFLSQCFMRYKVDPKRAESRMIRSYRL